jgi:hypothetical protein
MRSASTATGATLPLMLLEREPEAPMRFARAIHGRLRRSAR